MYTVKGIYSTTNNVFVSRVLCTGMFFVNVRCIDLQLVLIVHGKVRHVCIRIEYTVHVLPLVIPFLICMYRVHVNTNYRIQLPNTLLRVLIYKTDVFT